MVVMVVISGDDQLRRRIQLTRREAKPAGARCLMPCDGFEVRFLAGRWMAEASYLPRPYYYSLLVTCWPLDALATVPRPSLTRTCLGGALGLDSEGQPYGKN